MQIRALRGIKDVLPDESYIWQYLESTARRIFNLYNYKEIRTPIIEETALFQRGVGDTSDIVTKQMYSFQDRGGRDISMRPEGTASVVRAYIEAGLANLEGLSKLYYIGPMFRAERPQAGRLRQFNHIGVEAIGSKSPHLDAEIILLLMRFLEESGVSNFNLKINTLGCLKDKEEFSRLIKSQLKDKHTQLCEDCKLRFEKNPFRLLDCKNSDCKTVMKSLNFNIEHLCPDCKNDFEIVKDDLNTLGVEYTIDHYLVRGLDYYTKTVFEAASQGLGSQDAVAAGGRYDNLVQELGGDDVSAIGFAVGIERLILAVGTAHKAKELYCDCFIVTMDEASFNAGIKLLNVLRKNGISADIDYLGKSLKAQMRNASKINAKFTLIIGEDELKNEFVTFKDMRTSAQEKIANDIFVDTLLTKIAKQKDQ